MWNRPTLKNRYTFKKYQNSINLAPVDSQNIVLSLVIFGIFFDCNLKRKWAEKMAFINVTQSTRLNRPTLKNRYTFKKYRNSINLASMDSQSAQSWLVIYGVFFDCKMKRKKAEKMAFINVTQAKCEIDQLRKFANNSKMIKN